MARILLVDDDPDVHKSSGTLLTLSGHVVLHAYDGQQGLAMADPTQPEKPDLIITDLMMPSMNGRDMLAALRASGNRTPIIMCFTGAADPGVTESFRRTGADEVVPKGRPNQLLQAIARLLAAPSVPPTVPSPVRVVEKFTPPTILVVDDDSGVLVDLQTGLARRGYKVLLAGGGPQGISLALDEKLESRPNLIITDYVMPLVDGLELVEKVRAARLTLPIILYCAGISAASRDLVIRVGATEIIDKEARVDDLYAAVARLLKIGD